MNADPLPHLKTLGLDAGASREDVKKAFRDLSKVWHPDRFGEDPALQKKAEEHLKAINDAYRELQTYDPTATPGNLASDIRPPPRRNMGERVIRPKQKFHPTERLPLVLTIVTIIVVLLLVLTTL
jgi:curved DNA-binding protein CbpA